MNVQFNYPLLCKGCPWPLHSTLLDTDVPGTVGTGEAKWELHPGSENSLRKCWKAGERLAVWLKRITWDENKKEYIWGNLGGQTGENQVRSLKQGIAAWNIAHVRNIPPRDSPDSLWLMIRKDQDEGERRDGVNREERSQMRYDSFPFCFESQYFYHNGDST